MKITIPAEIVERVVGAKDGDELKMAISLLRAEYEEQMSGADDTDEWEDLDASELPRF